MILASGIFMAIAAIGLEAALFHDRFGDTISSTEYHNNQATLDNWGGISLYLVMETSMLLALTMVL